MKAKLFGLCFAALVLSITARADPANFFPIVNPENAFTGEFSIDPATPPYPFAANYGTGHLYMSPSSSGPTVSFGTMTVHIDGGTFSAPITVVAAPVPAGYRNNSWSADTTATGATPNNPTFNGISLPNGYINQNG
jgi:hypothetical protein